MKNSLQNTAKLVLLTVALTLQGMAFGQNLKAQQQTSGDFAISQPKSLDATHSAQTNSEIKNQSPFETVKGLKEDLSKRDAYSKHYINQDGSFTAIIGAGPIHFEKNGEFLDIDNKISPIADFNYPYANTTNLFESYFGATSDNGVKNKTMEGEVREFLNTKMYWEVNGQAVNTVSSSDISVRIDGDKAYYDNLYGTISAEFISLNSKRKLNYIIPNKQALGSIPTDADYLVFTEDVVLPFGWTSTVTEEGVVIKNQLGKEIYLYENPISTDASTELSAEENTIFETIQFGNTLTIRTKVKTDWLLNNDRQFPVLVDPTVTVTTNNANFWTGTVYTDGTKSGNFLRFGRWTTSPAANFARGWAKFNISSVPADIAVNSINVNFYIEDGAASYSPGNGHSLYLSQLLVDPVTASASSLYNTIGGFGYQPALTAPINSLGWKSHTLTSEALTNDMNNQNAHGWFALGFMANGSFSSGVYLQASNYASANRPYLVINYAFKLTVTEAYTDASYENGTHIPPADETVILTPGTRDGYVCIGWDGGTGDVPATGTEPALEITDGLTQSSSINWLWEEIEVPGDIVFYNYGSSYQLTFNNSRINTTSPVFRLSHASYDANAYEIEINDKADFTGNTWTASFEGTYPVDTETDFEFIDEIAATDGTTYYVRARVKGDTEYWSDWTSQTYSFTYDAVQEIPSWFQTTQAQLAANQLQNVTPTEHHEVVGNPEGNVIQNGNFADTTGWSTWKTPGTNATINVSSTDCYDCPSGTTRNLRFNLWTASATSGQTMVVSQEVDLTNVDEITYNANSYYGPNGSNPGGPISNLRLIIGGTANDDEGTTMHTTNQAYCPTYCSANESDQNISVDTSGFTGVHTVKFVVKFTQTHTTSGTLSFFVNNVVANSSANGTLTSTPIHFASVQDVDGFESLKWNQTLNGGTLTLKVQGSEDGIDFTDIAGYDNISEAEDGEHSVDLTELETIPAHLRLVGAFTGANVTLHDWEVLFYQDECENSTTWDGLAWSNGVPANADTKIIFTGDFTSDETNTDAGILIGCAVEVKNGSWVTISSEHNVIIDNRIVVANGSTFILKHDANLVQINEEEVVNTGNIIVEKSFVFSTARDQFNFVNSPVINQNIKGIYDGDSDAQHYDEASNLFVAFDGEYIAGRGQALNEAAEGEAETTAVFEGVPFNGSLSLENLSNENTGFHLIGNPYPSQLDLNTFYNDNTDLEPTFLFWDNRGNALIAAHGEDYETNNYAQYNLQAGGGTGVSAPAPITETRIPYSIATVGSSFMVRLNSEITNGKVEFNNAQRSIEKGVNFFGRGNMNTEADRYWLTMETPEEMAVMNAVVYFEGGNNAVALDDSRTPGGSDNIYSLVDEAKLDIQGKASFVDSDTITLGYNAYARSTYKIRLFEKEGVFANGQDIYLIDQLAGTYQNLNDNPEYTFTTEAGEFNDRFIIVYVEPETLSFTDISKGSLIVYKHGNQTVILSQDKPLTDLLIYNIQGQLLVNPKDINNVSFRFDNNRFGKQPLLLKVKTADGKEHNLKVLIH